MAAATNSSTASGKTRPNTLPAMLITYLAVDILWRRRASVVMTEDRLISTLHLVKREGEVNPSLNPEDRETRRLRLLAQRGLAHWCPYPDECYVMCRKGMELLAALG